MRTSFPVGGATKEFTESIATSGLSPEEILKHLDSYGIEWHVTQRGDLMIRYWQVGAEDFVPTEHVARIREHQTVPREANVLEWLSRNLAEVRNRYAGQWIAVVRDQVVASSSNLPDLLQKIRNSGIDEPFIMEVQAGPIVWATAYAR